MLLAASPAAKRAYLDKLEPPLPEPRREAFVDELNQISAEGISESDSEVDDDI